MAKGSGKGSKPLRQRTIDEVIADGFVLERGKRPITRLALASLRVSIESWLATSERLGPRMFSSATEPIPLEAYAHGWEYSVTHAEAIVHFQHFAELVCKDFLRSEHELLATVASSSPVVMYRLLKGQPIDDAELAQQKSVEFSEALETIVKLTRAGLIKPDLSFVAHHEDALRRMNTLRNRLWHRGTFALRVHALDELFGRFLLPFVVKVTALPDYKAAEKLWGPPRTACGIDVLAELERELTTPNSSRAKIVYLKELGRASYRNPLHEGIRGDWQNATLVNWATQSAKRRGETDDISTCPCCGVESLMNIEDEIDNGEGEIVAYCWLVRCECCTFHINSDLGNASDYGLCMPDFFVPNATRSRRPKRRVRTTRRTGNRVRRSSRSA